MVGIVLKFDQRENDHLWYDKQTFLFLFCNLYVSFYYVPIVYLCSLIIHSSRHFVAQQTASHLMCIK